MKSPYPDRPISHMKAQRHNRLTTRLENQFYL